MTNISRQSFQANLTQIKEIGSMLLPKGKSEWLIFGGFMLFYSSYSIIIALQTTLLYESPAFDLHFSFDTPNFFYNCKVTRVVHPLLKYLMAPYLFLLNTITPLFDSYKIKIVIAAITCCTLISASTVYIYRYLKEIIHLRGGTLYIPVFFYAFTSTNMILCFTPESFPISVFLLTFAVYYYSYAIKHKIGVRWGTNFSLALLLGGVTVSNFAKGGHSHVFFRYI
jgi:hypothetical protein